MAIIWQFVSNRYIHKSFEIILMFAIAMNSSVELTTWKTDRVP
jgi:hypothetical protein